MPQLRFVILMIFLGILTNSIHAEESGAPPAVEQIRAWIEDLKQEAFDKREEASRRLLDAGQVAQKELEKAITGENEILTRRAKAVLSAYKTRPIFKKMIAATCENKEIESDVTITQLNAGDTATFKGRFFAHPDEKRYRMDMTITFEKLESLKMKTRVISDGKYLWHETTMPRGEIRVQKFPFGEAEKISGIAEPGLPIGQIRQLIDRFDFTDAIEDLLDQEAVYILSGVEKEGFMNRQLELAREFGGQVAEERVRKLRQSFRKCQVFLSKSTFQFRKFEIVNRRDAIVASLQFSNFKTDVKVEDKISPQYEPPAGAEVRDMEEFFKKASLEKPSEQEK